MRTCPAPGDPSWERGAMKHPFPLTWVSVSTFFSCSSFFFFFFSFSSPCGKSQKLPWSLP